MIKDEGGFSQEKHLQFILLLNIKLLPSNWLLVVMFSYLTPESRKVNSLTSSDAHSLKAIKQT